MNSTMTRTALLFTIGLGLLTGCHASFKASANGQSNGPNNSSTPAAKPEKAKAAATKKKAEDKSAATTQTSTVQLRGGKLNMPGNLVFDTGVATLSTDPANEAVLEQLRLFLTENPKVTELRIEGHTDNVGDATSNMELSGNRALTVRNWLIGKGIAAERLLAVGFGDARPVADNATEEGRAQNRRTEFKLAGWEGKKYMGKDPTAGGKVFGGE
jgi:OmpA-OmpF porin, OOP family